MSCFILPKWNNCQYQFCVFNFSRSKCQITRLVVAHANKTPMGNEQARTQSRFFQSETLTLNSCLSLDYFTDLCKPIETYIYARKKHPFASYPAAKHPKHSKFTVTDIREKPVNFLHCSTRASTLVSAILLLSRAPLHKFQFLFINIIPWLDKVH